MADLISSLPGSAPKPKRVLDALIRYGLLLVLAAVVVFFSIAEPAFLRVNNLFIILQSVSIVALLALGVTLTMAVGGLDLSIGAVAAMSLMIASYVMVVLGWGAVPAVLISRYLSVQVPAGWSRLEWESARCPLWSPLAAVR